MRFLPEETVACRPGISGLLKKKYDAHENQSVENGTPPPDPAPALALNNVASWDQTEVYLDTLAIRPTRKGITGTASDFLPQPPP